MLTNILKMTLYITKDDVFWNWIKSKNNNDKWSKQFNRIWKQVDLICLWDYCNSRAIMGRAKFTDT